jgi:hypothetical protein
MPDQTFVYVGPYAKWVVPEVPPEDADPLSEAAEELATEVLDGTTLLIAGIGWGLFEVEGQTCRTYYGLPWEDRSGAPCPTIRAYADRHTHGYFDPFPRPVDLRGRDAEAELRWFQSAFAAELDRATEYFGRPPAFHWGFVAEQHW